ncbi:hypothetical protein [Streptomyces lavendulae]|uniref:hypothetical protein n=1 Tax=Streptomyces lavendulae TaxID=1914 RepID=UPI003801D55C
MSEQWEATQRLFSEQGADALCAECQKSPAYVAKGPELERLACGPCAGVSTYSQRLDDGRMVGRWFSPRWAANLPF